MPRESARDYVVDAFPSELGWIAVIGDGRTLRALAFGHKSADSACKALGASLVAGARRVTWNRELAKRLQAYAAGAEDMFLDIETDPGPVTPFRRKVLETCRRIPWGSTLSYGELASRVGCPGAARAVGNCMAKNCIPLVIPCHRVLASGGRLGGYSAPGGLSMKRRLLRLERSMD